jgi:ubiquinone/menaquinone biosynthesis C-methylase UbiE
MQIPRVASSVAPRVFTFLSRVYDLPLLQTLAYRSNHDAVMDELARRDVKVIVDVGCGTGVLTERIARELHPQRLVGCDASGGMLAKARERDVEVEWQLTRAESLPIESDAVDAIVCTEAFHFFDQPAAMAEFRRILRPGGSVIVVSVLTARGQMQKLVADAGLELVDQRVARRLPGMPGSLVTIARRSA